MALNVYSRSGNLHDATTVADEGTIAPMKVTLHEVAARAEVSIATVSRALNGLAVSKASLARVERAVRELGYVPNQAARALRAERTMTMGLIFSDLRNTLGIDLLDALSEAIEEAGYSLIISTARGDADRYDVLMRRFLERRIDALFCIAPHGRGEALAAYQAAGIPMIAMFGRGAAFAELPTVVPIFSEPAKALGEHLKALGHQRVAVVRREGGAAVIAITEALKAQGFVVEMVEATEADGMGGALGRLLANRPRPSVVIAADPQSRGLIAACAAHAVSVPGDLSIVSISEVGADAYHRRHAISAVAIDPQRMGRASGAAMLAWLAGARPADKIKVQAAQFTARASTGPALAALKPTSLAAAR
jgi:LacI family transcriptional regulator